MFTYGGGGGIAIEGCGQGWKTVYRVVRFGPGDTAYVCLRARRGVLERVVVKRIDLVVNERTYLHVVPFYVDTLNARYNEDDLCTEREAVELATAHYARRLADIDDLLRRC